MCVCVCGGGGGGGGGGVRRNFTISQGSYLSVMKMNNSSGPHKFGGDTCVRAFYRDGILLQRVSMISRWPL